MAQSKPDDNLVKTMLGVLNTDGTTPTLITISTSHILDVSDNTTGSDFGNDFADRDNNNQPTLIAVSSVDGTTPVPVYVNSSGQLLIDST